MTKDEKFQENIEKFIEETIDACRELPQTVDKSMAEEKYIEICKNASDYVTKEFEKADSFAMYEFVSIFTTTFYNYMIKNSSKHDIYLDHLVLSALRKYRQIIYCLYNDDLECGILLFRALYENILVMKFLSFNPACIESYIDFSIYSFLKKMVENKEMKENDIIKIKSDYDRIKSKHGDNLNNKYGWAKSVFQKDNITSKDLHNTLLSEIEPINIMLDISSELLDSSISGLVRYRISGDKYLKLLIDKNMEIFGIRFLIKSLYDIFCDNNFFEANVFLKIIEFALEKWGYDIKIR